jgi:hypothetical protein
MSEMDIDLHYESICGFRGIDLNVVYSRQGLHINIGLLLFDFLYFRNHNL